MLTVKTTDHLTGATICGNHSDLNTLYNALSNLVGNEGSYPEYDQCQLRILGLCYEIRHTYQGDRNTLEDIYGETNYSFEYLWPELIFIIGVLEEYCRLANGDRCYLLQNDDGGAPSVKKVPGAAFVTVEILVFLVDDRYDVCHADFS